MTTAYATTKDVITPLKTYTGEVRAHAAKKALAAGDFKFIYDTPCPRCGFNSFYAKKNECITCNRNRERKNPSPSRLSQNEDKHLQRWKRNVQEFKVMVATLAYKHKLVSHANDIDPVFMQRLRLFAQDFLEETKFINAPNAQLYLQYLKEDNAQVLHSSEANLQTMRELATKAAAHAIENQALAAQLQAKLAQLAEENTALLACIDTANLQAMQDQKAKQTLLALNQNAD